MHFHPDEEHAAYADTLRRLLEDAAPLKAARAWAAGDRGPGGELWRALAGTGLVALAVPEEREGGLGFRTPELASAFVELGRAGVPGPAVETVALAAGLGAGPATGRDAAPDGRPPSASSSSWLVPALEGDALLTVADPAAEGHALDAHVADAAFVLEGGVLRGAVAEGSPRPSIDPVRHLVRCVPDGAPLPADTERLYAVAVLLTAAQALGAGQALLEGGTRHAAQRVQFGRPIGSFQAVKHQLADVAVELEFARPLLYGAAVAVGGGDFASRDLYAAKAACGEASYAAARTALQVHGALGYTDEYDLTLLLRKARALRGVWGAPGACRAAVLR
ncbi:acyl-CoA dehydrogenase family protein [Streptomyces sp. ODS28]|uniref:acyl-CoA dehydrogenase family protein n=1 Tax=Streptomyces sp. ODS28 TaxID=3136688 RepID=UPI0031E64CBD